MASRLVLIASAIIGLLFGGMFLFNADGTIQSFRLGPSDVASAGEQLHAQGSPSFPTPSARFARSRGRE
jgi:hypothetical protein